MPLISFLPGRLKASALNAALDITRTTYQIADQIRNNNTTLVESPDLDMPLAANSIYAFDSVIMYDTNATADFKQYWLLPSLSTILIARWDSVVGSAATDTTIAHNVIQLFEFASGGVAVGTIMSTRAAGTIFTGANAGNLVFLFAQNTANVSDTILKRGSWIRTTKVA